MARFFKKLYSQQKEIIDDDFPELEDDKVGDYTGIKIITNLKSKGNTIKTTGFKHPNGAEVEGTIEPEFKLTDYDVTLKGKIQTSNKYEGTVSLSDKLGKGSTLFVTGKTELGPKPKESIEFGFDYLSKDLGSVNLKFISPISFESKDIEFYGAGVGYYQGASLGVDVQTNLSPFNVTKSNGYLQYDNSNYSVGLFGKLDNKKKTSKAGLGFYQTINDSTKAALEISADPRAPENATLKVAGSYKFDDYTSIRPRISIFSQTKEMRLGFVLKQTLSPIAKLTVSTDLSTNSLFQDLSEETVFKKNQFGVTVTFFD